MIVNNTEDQVQNGALENSRMSHGSEKQSIPQNCSARREFGFTFLLRFCVVLWKGVTWCVIVSLLSSVLKYKKPNIDVFKVSAAEKDWGKFTMTLQIKKFWY